MSDHGFFAKPTDDSKGRMLGAAGRTIKAVLNLWTGIGGDAVEVAYLYVSGHIKERNKRRAEAFKAHIEKAGPKVLEVIESPKQSEPLFDVFLSVYRDCLSDDEDEKVPYYAAFMVTIASGPAPRPQLYIISMLTALKDLRAHDLRVLELFLPHSGNRPGKNIDELVEQARSKVPPPRIGMDLIEQSVSALARYGLVVLDAHGLNAVVGAKVHYKITTFGAAFWEFINGTNRTDEIQST